MACVFFYTFELSRQLVTKRATSAGLHSFLGLLRISCAAIIWRASINWHQLKADCWKSISICEALLNWVDGLFSSMDSQPTVVEWMKEAWLICLGELKSPHCLSTLLMNEMERPHVWFLFPFASGPNNCRCYDYSRIIASRHWRSLNSFRKWCHFVFVRCSLFVSSAVRLFLLANACATRTKRSMGWGGGSHPRFQ